MKNLIKYTLSLFILMGLSSCFEAPQTIKYVNGDQAGSNGNTGSSGNWDFDPGNGNGNDPGTGTGNDPGNGNYGPPYSWDVRYAGGVSWYPRSTPEPEASNCNSGNGNSTPYTTAECKAANSTLLALTTPTINDARTAFQADSRFKVRITVKEKPPFDSYSGGNNSTLDQKIYCYRRKLPAASQPNDDYTKLTFKVLLKPIVGNSLGAPVGNATTTKTVSVGQSTIIDYSYARPSSNEPYAIQIDDVRVDSGSLVRSFSCWGMTVEVSTDYTRDF